MKKENENIYCPDIKSYLELNQMAHTQKHKDFHIVSLAEFSYKRTLQKVNAQKP